MYRMIKVQPSDQHFQRILWRNFADEPIRTYELTTVTYGTASAPYLATKCLQTLAIEGAASYPNAAKSLKENFYVDDMLTGVDTIEDGKLLVQEMVELTESGGFTLRKWVSNEPQLLEDLPENLLDDRTTLELDSSSSPVKTLGLLWEHRSDRFMFRSPAWNDHFPITKRIVLADAARLFDPLGLIGPVIVQAKIFLQQLWKQKCDWDEPLATESQNFWLEYRRNLLALESLHVPRWTGFSTTSVSTEIHGFCDASEVAYGACLYLRSTSADGSVTVRLITAKSRVAPLEDPDRKKKRQSIPRLELSSALLLSHLYEKLVCSIQTPMPAYFWTDSMIVKCWLSSLPSRWQSFVANRVSEIQHITRSGVWNHVAGVENPADIISRGMAPAQLQYQKRWFEGPQWVSHDRSTWPITTEVLLEPDQSLLEEKSSVTLSTRAKPPNELFSLCSSFPDLVHMTGWIRRFVYNTKAGSVSHRRRGQLSFVEYEEAVTTLVRLAQQESFPEEIGHLAKGRQVQSSSILIRYDPQLVDGIIRLGGRLAHAPISEIRKHPMILHHQHPLTKLIISHYHRKLFHAGQQLLIASVREKFWPTRIRDLARRTIHQCVQCFRSKPKVHEQIMADLPSVRVNPAAVFQKVGVDLCGPFYIRYPVRRSVPVKCFVGIFICLTTKAVHIEIVADLSTQAFLAAFRRFVAIRGRPRLVMCDNATNFVGANRELKELRQQLNDQQFKYSMIRAAEDDGIEFKFIPARSPNFGGLWEAAVKSFKGHFRRTIGNNPLSYDELHTIVQQVASVLNSRPLTPLSNDPHDYTALTPGHFLTGRPLTAVPEPDLQDIPENRLALWQRSQAFVQRIWRKWKTEYLSSLQARTKWTKKRDNIKIGTMVLVKEENLPPQKWRLGRVAEVFFSTDGNIRVVTVRTKDGTFRRGIAKICVLPIRDNIESQHEEN
ncbi:uncharacterized protein LOC131692951 [Topomyia yanbarensis]|uniref:uncharacterized protein LOC131692951 n=1 Tax=Topomyia yanbarensis TaxID=2498891 RepID=UPI00273B41E5|nr:uncharacterized protein LOC131692951 [Topomyia yanbarensis]